VGVEVVAVELPTRLKPAHISATLPPLEAFHTKLGLKEAALLRVAAGSFSFGQNVVDLPAKRPTFFMPGARMGRPSRAARFFPAGSRRGVWVSTDPFNIFA